jgi:hypothetical protein
MFSYCATSPRSSAPWAQAGDGVVDIVNGEHDAMQAQRVGRRVLWRGVGRRGGVVLGQLQLAVAVRSPLQDQASTLYQAGPRLQMHSPR